MDARAREGSRVWVLVLACSHHMAESPFRRMEMVVRTNQPRVHCGFSSTGESPERQ